MSILRSYRLMRFTLLLLAILSQCVALGSFSLLVITGTLTAISWYITEGPRGRSIPPWIYPNDLPYFQLDRLSVSSDGTRLHPHSHPHAYLTWFLLNRGDVFLLKQNLVHILLVMVEHYFHMASPGAVLRTQ